MLSRNQHSPTAPAPQPTLTHRSTRLSRLGHAGPSIERMSQTSDGVPVTALREPIQRVCRRARALWTVEALLEALMFVAIVAVASISWIGVDDAWWIVVLALLGGAAWVVVVPRWRYLTHRWEVTETAVYTQTGWWARERRIAPMSRIQTVDHAEGPLERLFRLASVTITTASAAGALSISGLDRDVARALVADLTRQADVVAGDAT